MMGSSTRRGSVSPSHDSFKSPVKPASLASEKNRALKKVDQSKVYGFLDRMRQGIHCSFCGGAKCKHENWEYARESGHDIAIEGLASSWVGADVIASQRPSTSLFKKHSLIEQFKERGITGVLNLQEKGEHARCGPDGVYASTGYSYDGEEDLMRFKISYYEFPWADMTAPKQDIVLRSVQVMDSHVKKSGKVLVHCHAGLGRTGLIIACYLVYAHRMPSADVIAMVRERRPGAIQTSKQVRFVYEFEAHLRKLSHTFRLGVSDSAVDIDVFLKKQRLLLHGEHADFYRFIPMPIYILLRQLLSITSGDSSKSDLVLTSLRSSASPPESVLDDIRVSINGRSFDETSVKDVLPLCHLVWGWFKSLAMPALLSEETSAIVAYMREPPCGRSAQRRFIRRTLRPSALHTAEMLLSAIYVISLNAEDSFMSQALQRVIELLTRADGGEGAAHLSLLELELLHKFFGMWVDLVKGMYFSFGCARVRDENNVRTAKVSTVRLPTGLKNNE
uniref:Uncharacterized protein TCIL3000_11_14250 n=1 Tax=Trypanosoma congolense (strain IL3000) TaxID=1068625 RepID=G0V2N8_TRYCI|nr:unnamed protein product [Trypanosoma congolense IL3000]